MPTPLTIHQSNPALRQSSDSVWPLRCADQRTFAERAAEDGNVHATQGTQVLQGQGS